MLITYVVINWWTAAQLAHGLFLFFLEVMRNIQAVPSVCLCVRTATDGLGLDELHSYFFNYNIMRFWEEWPGEGEGSV